MEDELSLIVVLRYIQSSVRSEDLHRGERLGVPTAII